LVTVRNSHCIFGLGDKFVFSMPTILVACTSKILNYICIILLQILIYELQFKLPFPFLTAQSLFFKLRNASFQLFITNFSLEILLQFCTMYYVLRETPSATFFDCCFPSSSSTGPHRSALRNMRQVAVATSHVI
jgi:hypothetical protein